MWILRYWANAWCICFEWDFEIKWYFALSFCPVHFIFVLTKQLPNEWRCFCACRNYCILCWTLAVPCAISYWFICFVFRFLLLHVWFRCCLIFCSDFVHCLPDFGSQFLTFACFAVCTFASVSLPGLARLFLAIFCFLLCSGMIVYTLLAKETCFVVIVKVLLILLIWLVFACFGSKIGLLHQFAFARFDIFLCFLAVVSACPFDRFMQKPFACLNRSKLCLLLSLLGFLVSPMLA